MPQTLARAAPANFGLDAALKAKQAVQTIAAGRKRRIEAEKSQALANPRFQASDSARTEARAKIEQIRERVSILRKMLAGDPKALARALAQVFKELKAAVEAYKAAGGQALGLSANAADMAVTPEDEREQAEAQEDVALADGRSLYQAVTDEMRRDIGEDGLNFAREVRDLAHKLSELLESARTTARGRAADKPTDEALAQADEALRSLRDELASMERDIRQAVPLAGSFLKINA